MTSALGRRKSDRPTLAALPLMARAYVVGVSVAGAACLVWSINTVTTEQLVLFVLLSTLAIAASAAKIELPLGRGQSKSNLSLAHVVNFWALFGNAPAVWVAVLSAIAQCTIRTNARNPLHRVVFSTASLAITVTVASLPFMTVIGADRNSISSLLKAAAIAAPLYFFVNTMLVAAVVALTTRQPILSVWHRNFLWSAPSYLAGAALAVAAAVTWERGLFVWLLLLAVPMYLVFRSYHMIVARLREEQNETRKAMDVQVATIEALALAIEAKAGCTPEHVRSIQQFATILADAAGMSDAEVQTVRTAALLHDIGNMAVPEHILAKSEGLTPEELERMKIHPRVGAEILRDVPFSGNVAELVLCHHERWDGTGYPGGLRGEDIPLGARVIAIADCFSTLQTERPYRPARTEMAAAAVLRQLAGSAFDPRLVDVFIARLHTPAAATTAFDDEVVVKDTRALDDISGTHREEQVLYELAQALGSSLAVDDAMVLIHDKVNRLVPFVTCALFLGNDEQGFICRYAQGPGTEALFKWAPKSWSELSLRLPSCADGRAGRGEDLAAALPCPLTYGDRLIGAMVVYHTRPKAFSDEHRRVLGRVSEQAAAVIFNSTRYEQTQHESQTDALTSLPNRRSFDRQFATGLARCSDHRSQASLVVLDLDRLKEINDTYGHEAGDRALRAVGAVLRSTVREGDLCARFAGDEFIVVLWDCNPDHQDRRVADLQNAVSAYPFEPRTGVLVPLSISAGCARFPDDGRSFDQLLVAADERMYQDKAGRRSRNSRNSKSRNEAVELA